MTNESILLLVLIVFPPDFYLRRVQQFMGLWAFRRIRPWCCCYFLICVLVQGRPLFRSTGEDLKAHCLLMPAMIFSQAQQGGMQLIPSDVLFMINSVILDLIKP